MVVHKNEVTKSLLVPRCQVIGTLILAQRHNSIQVSIFDKGPENKESVVTDRFGPTCEFGRVVGFNQTENSGS